ncbi:hypothetical protein K1719_002865 [Acacia pycnantha]|nr:hypothetical protein K1719_002865 [Acacia pycnantha]
MCADIETMITIDSQIEKFDRAEGLFGNSLAIATRDRKQPALWWNSFGDDCKELQTIAIHILSLTCSATGCERNWSVFDQIHSKRINRLEQQRLNALVFVKYNLQLEIRKKQREEKGDTYDPICLSDLDYDEEWITEQEDPCLMDGESWMDVHECFNVDEGDQSKKRRPESDPDHSDCVHSVDLSDCGSDSISDSLVVSTDSSSNFANSDIMAEEQQIVLL